MQRSSPLSSPIPWLSAGQDFPSVDTAWGTRDPAPGLLAAGGVLDVPTLIKAYAHGIFPWYSAGQPVLWWSTDPRMVLKPSAFRLHRSLRKAIHAFAADTGCSIRFDSAFATVIRACASRERHGQSGTWIVPEMIEAYIALHEAGHAHSVETWRDGVLVGGLYCINLGRMVFGESMFAYETDTSKIALAALVAFCRQHAIDMIDCQQNTGHLASLGASEISRGAFAAHVSSRLQTPPPVWQFDPVYWQQILPKTKADTL
ncbi:MAG: leucyl/phenylalanyl-tRNA--protein transferase [Polaromonas sp.]|nr:leucyl/phenylalanyl-tRNA--protein transferase [Polaromonas sp.]